MKKSGGKIIIADTKFIQKYKFKKEVKGAISCNFSIIISKEGIELKGVELIFIFLMEFLQTSRFKGYRL